MKVGKRKFLSSSTSSLADDEELELSASGSGSPPVLLSASVDGTHVTRRVPHAWHLLLRIAKEEMESMAQQQQQQQDVMVNS